MQEQADWNDFLYFLKVADCGNLKGAAQMLGVNNSTVFRRINGLEERLQVRLFERLTSGYRLTEAGVEILGRVRQVEEEMHAIHRTLQGKDAYLRGPLKISTTDTIGYYWLPPFIRRFKEQYPDIVVDLAINNRYTDLSKREADVVIPAVNKQPDYMVGKKIAPIFVKLTASKRYIERFGRPDTIGDFSRHRFILPDETLAGLPANKWLSQYVQADQTVVRSDTFTGLLRLARQDLGLTLLPHYVVEADSEMVAVMDLPEKYKQHIWILAHPDIRHTGRVNAFMRFMYEETAQAAAGY